MDLYRMPMFKTWYEGKRPVLQIKILKVIALDGESSKKRLQVDLDTHYSDIFDAVEILKKKQIIEEYRVDKRSRRPEQYYKLTKRGLEIVIDEFSDPEIFWKGIIFYCELSKLPVSSEEIDKYYKPFEAKHLGYSQGNDFFFQSDFIAKLFDEWFMIPQNDPIAIFQKVLECIALHPSITLEQIIEYLEIQKTKYEDSILKQYKENRRNNARLPDFTIEFELRYQKNDVSKENIKDVLDRYTFFPDYSLDQFLGVSGYNEMSSQYYNFISHLLIHAIEDKTGNKRYELTLFGVILTLAMVQVNHRNPWKVFFNQFLDRPGNANYYSRVALNYKDKLPLIFGKWKLLADVFSNLDNLMMNFGLVFSKEFREQLISLPMNIGGIKELYENIQQIASYRFSKLTRIYNSGESVLMNKEIESDRMLPVIKVLSEIELRLATADLKRFLEYISEPNSDNIVETNIVTSIENSFANEVSFLFYISLARQAEFLPEFKDAPIFPSRLSKFIEHDTEQSNLLTSRRILRWVLEDDNEIRERFSIWCKDSISYEKQIMDSMLNLQREVGLS
jgi:DNA-binding PadR family transcriptional regulator